jgi:lysosomal Pro-X carboxypeptidase
MATHLPSDTREVPDFPSWPARAAGVVWKRSGVALALASLVAAPLLLFSGIRDTGASLSSVRGARPEVAAMTMTEYELNPDGTPNLLKECEEKFFTQTLDHFDVGAPTYQQRYFVCDKNYREDNGVMFFYVGNEADVELYLNNTGLMWENAKEFGAMMVFAEHRYFGKSLPFGEKEMLQHMKYLSTEQAIADYAVLITHLKEVEYQRDIPVVGFGGSYGGMLGSWFRMKYPNIIDGVIAGSAPILSFLADEVPLDKGSYAHIVTFDASEEAGAAPNCIPNIRRTWPAMREFGKTPEGRDALKKSLSLCDSVELNSADDVESVLDWGKSAFDYMAMGNYPYPSPYIMNGMSVLPAYPVRVACSHVAGDFPEGEQGDLQLLEAFAKSLGVYYNSTHDQQCFELAPSSDASAVDSDFWDYIFCSEIYQPQNVDGVNDMFWSIPWNFTADNENCKKEWGIEIRPGWATTQYGGRKALRAASNIVFSNGNFDPWSGTGVLEDFAESVVAVKVEGGAHHLDLMFSNPLDTPSLKAARATELAHIRKWINQFYTHKAALLHQ